MAEILSVITGFEPHVLLGFIAAGLLLNITPGADFIFITASGISGGPKMGIAAAIGVNIGVAVHIVLAAAGISALLLASPSTYDAIRYAGAAYLMWLAIQAWRASGTLGAGRSAHSSFNAIKRGFITNVLNPKTALFIFAFIPQFTDPAIGSIPIQILFLGAIFLFFGFLFALALAALAGKLSTTLRSHAVLLNRLSAFMFGGLAVRLAID